MNHHRKQLLYSVQSSQYSTTENILILFLQEEDGDSTRSVRENG